MFSDDKFIYIISIDFAIDEPELDVLSEWFKTIDNAFRNAFENYNVLWLQGFRTRAFKKKMGIVDIKLSENTMEMILSKNARLFICLNWQLIWWIWRINFSTKQSVFQCVLIVHSLLADLFLYSYEAESIHTFLKDKILIKSTLQSLLIFLRIYWWCLFTEYPKFQSVLASYIHVSQWTWI